MPNPRETEVRRGGFVFFPRTVYRPTLTVTIVDVTNVTRTVTADVVGCTVQRSEIEIIGNYELTILNTDGKYYNAFGPRSTVTISFDYESGTTTQLTGRIDAVYYNLTTEGFVISIKGRQVPEVMDKTLNISFKGALINEAINAVVDDLNSHYTSSVLTRTGVVATARTVTATYRNQTYWSIIIDLVRRAEQGCYINATNDLVTYEIDTVTNAEEAIEQGETLIGCNGFGTDYNLIENKITVYGKQDDGALVLATAQDKDNQAQSWVKEAIVSDSSIRSSAEAEERAAAELRVRKQTTGRGGFSCTGMPTIQPGQRISAIIPFLGLNGNVKVKEFTHSITMSGFTTEVTVERLQKTLSLLFRERIKEDEGLRNFENPNNMENSYYFTFDDANQALSLNSVSIMDGMLILNTSIDTGTFISIAKTTSGTISAVEVRLKGDDLNLSTTSVSANNGLDFEEVTPGVNNTLGEVHAMTVKGKQIVLRITLHSSIDFTTPRVDTATVLFR